MLVFSSGNLLLWWVCSFLADEPLQLSLSDESFYLLLQVVTVGYVMTVVMVEVAVLVSRPFIRISLQLARKCHGSFILDLHQDLVDRGSQRGEACEPLCGGFGVPILPSVFGPLSCRASSYLSLFLGFLSRASTASFEFMYFVSL